jgi:hypothetical protein
MYFVPFSVFNRCIAYRDRKLSAVSLCVFVRAASVNIDTCNVSLRRCTQK